MSNYLVNLRNGIYLRYSLVALLMVSCSVNGSESEQKNECILQEIQFDEFNSLKLQTISGGRIYRLSQEFTFEGETKIVESFLYKYFPDSIAILDQNDPYSLYPYISVRLKDQKPIKVVKFFSNSGVRLMHKFDYSENNIIRIDLTRIVSTGEVFYEGYSNYYMDSDRNVIRNESYAADRNNSGQFKKYEDRVYVYDNYSSPQQHLYLPFFVNRNFPDVKFFSDNNILSFTEDEEIFQFQNEYGMNENLVSQTLPNGQSVFFKYVNCPP